MRVSYSKVSTFAECRQHFHFVYIDKIRPKADSTITTFGLGRAGHAAIAELHKGGTIEAAREAIDKEFAKMSEGFIEPTVLEKMSEVRARTIGIVNAYGIKWAEGSLPIRKLEQKGPVLVEQSFTKPLSDVTESSVTGIVDLCLPSLFTVVDHKFVSAVTGPFVSNYQTSFQNAIYLWLAGLDKDTHCASFYNLIGKPALRLRKGDSLSDLQNRITEKMLKEPDKYFALIEDVQGREDCENRFADFVEIADVIESCQTYYKNRRACANFGGCKFLPLCTKGWTPETELLYDRKS